MAQTRTALHPTTVRRRVSILGATGSIGRNTLDVIAQHPERFDVVALTAHRDAAGLAVLARKIQPHCCVVADTASYAALKEALAGTGIIAMAGADALCEAAAMPADLVVASIVGAAGLAPVMMAAQQGAHIALANKEALVCAGALLTRCCAQSGSMLLPVDSEHSAIFQVFDTKRPETISHITLTASGGPFLHHTSEQLAQVSPQDAVRHPNWDMGAKISVDSATMMNKALEMIEAYHLFPLRPSQIEVMIHPQSVVHSMVHHIDGSVLAQLGTPDMRTPIAYALAWPERLTLDTPKLDLAAIGTLEFLPANTQRWRAIALARTALEQGAEAAITLNAANEIAVAAFLEGKIPFTRIISTAEEMLTRQKNYATDTLEDVLALDNAVRRQTQEYIGS